MKVIKWLAIILGALIVLFLVVGAFLPNHYTLERTIVIAKSGEIIGQQVTNFPERVKWSPWAAMDPAASNTFEGTPGAIGSSWTWDGDPAMLGKGTMTVLKIEPALIENKLEFISPRQSVSKDVWKFEEAEGGTLVHWIFEADLGYPIERYLGAFVFDTMLAPTLDKGLEALKTTCESMPDPEIEDMTSKEEGGAQ